MSGWTEWKLAIDARWMNEMLGREIEKEGRAWFPGAVRLSKNQTVEKTKVS